MNYKDHILDKSEKQQNYKSLSLKTDAKFVNEINQFCLKNNLSVAGLIIDLLVDFYNDNLYLKDNPTYEKGFEELKLKHYSNRTRVKPL